MKKSLIYSFLLAALLLSGCHKKLSDTTPLEAPQQVLMPRNAYEMDTSTGQSVIFEWDYSMGGNVRYQIVFDRENGNFSTPVYSVLSDNGGVSPKATLTSSILRSIAKTAGAAAGETVTVLWTVRTFKGAESVTGVKEGQPRSLILTLPVDIPASLVLSGSAVKDGTRTMDHALSVSTDPAKVIEKRSENAFSSYLELQDGNLTLTDNTGHKYYLKAGGTVAQLGKNEAEKASPLTGLHFIAVDFGNLTWTSKSVKNVWFWFHPWNLSLTQKQMSYAGNGVWTVTFDGFNISWDDNGTKRYDSRHYFRIDYNDNDTERAGHHKKDCSPSEIDTEGFYDVCLYRDFQDSDGPGAHWFYAWKTRDDKEGDGKKATVTLTLRGEPYTYSITFND